MNRSANVIAKGVLSLMPLFAAPLNVYGVEIRGFIGDQAGTKPASGIPGAKVTLIPAQGKRIESKGTNAKGEYSIKDVPKAKYKVIVDVVGYIPRPHDHTEVDVDDKDVVASDILLWKANAAEAYYDKVAEIFVAESGQDAGDKKKVYTNLWNTTRSIDLAPKSKYYLIKSIDKRDGIAKDVVPEMKDYLVASPDHIARIQKAVGFAIEGKESIPAKLMVSELGIGHELLGDIVLHELKGSSLSPEQILTFTRNFDGEWGKTSAGIRVKEWSRFVDKKKEPR